MEASGSKTENLNVGAKGNARSGIDRQEVFGVLLYTEDTSVCSDQAK